jgi:putative pyruvate formate lyase activating enzyme
VIDQNQNIRANNLELSELCELFEDCFEQEQNIQRTYITSRNCKNIDEINEDIKLILNYYNSCEICFRKCKVDRNNNKLGWCNLSSENNVYMTNIINDEENLISPTYAIYLSSCNIKCEYCHQKRFMKPDSREYISLSHIIEDVSDNLNRIKTVSFIGGNPDLSILTILKIITMLYKNKIDLPLVLNSNFLFTEKLYPLVDQYFNVLIPDFKFWYDKCSRTLCGLTDYKKIVLQNILYFMNKKDMIIRHLPLDDHWNCCSRPIIDWLAEHILNNELCSLSFLDLLQSDNSYSIKKCKKYANSFNLNLI